MVPNTSSRGQHFCRLCIVAALCALASVLAAAEPTPIIKTIVPAEINDPLTNPNMGWGIWAGPRYYDGTVFSIDYNTSGFGDDAPLFSWVLIDWMWSDLEPQEGQYYWKDLDTIIDYWASRGKQIELRVWVTDDPGFDEKPGSEVCPEWLWKAGARYDEYIGEANSKKREPDYLDPSYEKIYLPKVKKFLGALAERYDKPESPIVLWGVMGYGQWGEWHTMTSHYPWPNREVKHNVLAKIVSMYADIFKVKQPSISYVRDSDAKQANAFAERMYRQALDVAVSKGFALARHGFIDGIDFIDRQIAGRYWQQLPMWAEADWSYTDVKNHGTHGTLEENLEVMLELHSNYAHFYMDAESYKRAMREDRKTFERGLRSGGLGYRLVLTSASWREEVPAGHLFLLKQSWVNQNVGRLYKRFPLKLYLTDSQGNEKFSEEDRGFDETSWVQGKTYSFTSVFHLPKELPPGDYDLHVALVNEKGNPRIKLAIQGGDTKGKYKLGTIRILPP